MESGSSGNFDDYDTLRQRPGETSGGGSSLPSEGEEKCEIPIENVLLEEVGSSAYFKKTHLLPVVGAQVKVSEVLIDGRVAVIDPSNSSVIGNLPTKFNYLRVCIERGYSYAGEITEASKEPFPSVEVSLTAIK